MNEAVFFFVIAIVAVVAVIIVFIVVIVVIVVIARAPSFAEGDLKGRELLQEA